MAPISPNGPSNPYNGSGHIVPLRTAVTPLQPLPRATRPLRTGRPTTTRFNRKGRLGGGGEHVETGAVDNADSAIDPTNKYRRRSGSPEQDTITVSDNLMSHIVLLRLLRKLPIWSPNVKELFSWGAQSVKGFISFHFGLDRPGHVDAVPYGYRAGGGY